MPMLSYVHHLFNVEQCHASIYMLRWKEPPLQCPRRQSQEVDPWGHYHYRPGANALDATAARAPSMTSLPPCSTRASSRRRPGFSPPSGCTCRVRLDALPGN